MSLRMRGIIFHVKSVRNWGAGDALTSARQTYGQFLTNFKDRVTFMAGI
jgi:hypothetical protein